MEAFLQVHSFDLVLELLMINRTQDARDAVYASWPARPPLSASHASRTSRVLNAVSTCSAHPVRAGTVSFFSQALGSKRARQEDCQPSASS